MELTPDIVNLIEAGFGVLFIVGIILFVRVAGKAIQPFETMTRFIQQSLEQLDRSQYELREVIEINNASVQKIGENIARLVDKIIESDAKMASEVANVYKAQLKLELESKVGVLVLDEQMHTVLYSDSALSLLGWEKKHLPSPVNGSVPPTLNAAGDKIGKDAWPGAIALRIGKPILNVPLQIYSVTERQYIWTLVSAYPCQECLTNGQKWVTVLIRKLEELGRI